MQQIQPDLFKTPTSPPMGAWVDVEQVEQPPVRLNPNRVIRMSLAKQHPEFNAMVLPLVAYHSFHNEERWVTWIAPDFIDRNQLEKFGINKMSFRMMVDSSEEFTPWKLLLSALENGTSSLVVANLPDLDTHQLEALEASAEKGNCKVIVLQ